jgi:Alginate lyase
MWLLMSDARRRHNRSRVAPTRLFTRSAAGAKVVGVKSRASKLLALSIGLAMFGCGSSAPETGAATEPGADGAASGSGGSGGSTGVIVSPPDSSSGTSEGGGSVDATAPLSHADGAALDAGPTGFVHPGILVNRAQLDLVKSKLGVEPYKSAFAQASSSRYGSLSYAPAPIAVVECGSFSNPDIGCTAEKNDATAAYTHALLFYLGGQEAHAKKAIEIMNGWSAVLKDHTNSNAPLQSAWTASVFPRAAEIIRATYQGWAAADVSRFAAMLRDVYLPKVINGDANTNGNWELSMAEASVAISVFLDDRATFDKAITMWRKRVPAYFYVSSDGALPVPPPGGNKSNQAALVSYWYDQATFIDGLCQETCRDLGHVQYGLAAMINAAETAHIQGVDLYGDESKRIIAGLEFHAKYLNGAAVPSSLCTGTLVGVSPAPTWEIAYNHYANRAKASLPQTKALIAKIRPVDTDHHMDWETLTHAEVGSVGTP